MSGETWKLSPQPHSISLEGEPECDLARGPSYGASVQQLCEREESCRWWKSKKGMWNWAELIPRITQRSHYLAMSRAPHDRDKGVGWLCGSWRPIEGRRGLSVEWRSLEPVLGFPHLWSLISFLMTVLVAACPLLLCPLLTQIQQ